MDKAGNVLAMLGKDCLGIVSEYCIGSQDQAEEAASTSASASTSTGAETDCSELNNVFKFGERLLVGFSGLNTDILEVRSQLRFRKNMHELKENCDINPVALTNLLSNLLYEHRFGPFLIESIVAGFDQDTMEPYICSMDLLGQANVAKDFVALGKGSDQLYGVSQALWRPNLEPDQLFEVICQSAVSALHRDSLRGWGSKVMILEFDQLTEHTMKGRVD
ncbi:hypothetical protein ACLKA6_009945 [Drosophila palustris]